MQDIKVLIADDNQEIVDIVDEVLHKEGYSTIKAYDGESALRIMQTEDISLAILDVMMPRMDGFSVTQRVRENKNVPILILSAKCEETDRIEGLSIGADDYLTKPFHKGELLAHVNSLLRRYIELGGVGHKVEKNGIRYYDLYMDFNEKKLLVRGENVHLTLTEYRIMELMLNHPGRVFSIEELYEKIWGQDSYEAENSVTLHIGRIRKKIELNPKKPEYLKVIWGMGYKIEKT